MELFLIILFSYLMGSIPFGYILTKIFLKKDIRKIGSGNIGATNALRTGNKILGYSTLSLDILKAIIPILLIIGFKTRIAATLMFLFTLIVSIIFHSDFSNNMQIIAFLKNLSISGGFLIIASYEAKKFTIDYYLKYKKLK